MRIIVTYWNSEGDEERGAIFNGAPENFPYWLQGLCATGSFVTGVNTNG